MNRRDMQDMFKVKIEHDGKPFYKGKVRGSKGLKKIFDDLEFKFG
jgi:hypothetical protein